MHPALRTVLAELAASCLLILKEFQGRIEKTKTHWAGFKLSTNLTWPSFSVLGLSEPVSFSSRKKGTGTELTKHGGVLYRNILLMKENPNTVWEKRPRETFDLNPSSASR